MFCAECNTLLCLVFRCTYFVLNVPQWFPCVNTNTDSALDIILLSSHHQFTQFLSGFIDFKNNLALTKITGSYDPWMEWALCDFNKVDT